MIGLIRKDMYCLRKNLMMFFLVTGGVILISLLFIISSKYGNIAMGITEIDAAGQMSEETFRSYLRTVVIFVLAIPVAFVGMVQECFKEDRKAGFFKCMISMPLSDRKIVGSRYVACMIFAVISILGSCVAGFFVSLADETFLFKELVVYVFIFASILLIYMSFVMFMLYLFGVEKADLIQCAPFVVILAIGVYAVERKLLLTPKGEETDLFLEMTKRISEFVADNWYIAFLVALLCMGVSFFGSCQIVKKRRGNI